MKNIITKIEEFRKINENVSNNFEILLNDLKLVPTYNTNFNVFLGDKKIGDIRLNHNTIPLDTNKTGRYKIEYYYTLSWERDVCKKIFGVDFHNGSRKEDNKINALNYKVSKVTMKENPITIKKIKKYLLDSLKELNNNNDI